MSAYHEIFIRSMRTGLNISDQPEELLADLALVIGVPFKPVSDDISRVVDFAAGLPTAKVDVELSHDYDDYHDMPFSQYPALITIRDLARDQQRSERTARDIFQKLSRLGKYSLLLVFDLQVKLDSC